MLAVDSLEVWIDVVQNLQAQKRRDPLGADLGGSGMLTGWTGYRNWNL
jgi:hypothetical protein